ncbi:MAG: hypothetical protein JSS43_16975, partial [Proteobacteria bacterium]|nr:hypothetical protein [Pseudomonadota bacterium]
MEQRASLSEPPPSPADLTICDREPIHIPGRIQPHGILFVLAGPELRVAAVSANVSRFLGRDADSLLHAPISEFLEE